MIFPPKLITERIILKAVTENDVISYEKYFVDYEIIRHLSSGVPWPYPKNGVKAYIKENIIPKQGKDKWVWGIFLKENSEELIGVVDLWRLGKPEHRGFWLGRKFWGKGIMTEAVNPITEFAFQKLGFETLIFSNAKGNIASRRVKEKTGSVLLRIEPCSFVDPKYTEHEIWELTKEAWLSNNK